MLTVGLLTDMKMTPTKPKWGFQRFLGWFLMNGAYAGLFWYAVNYESVGAERAFTFMTWLMCFLGISAGALTKVEDFMRKNVPKYCAPPLSMDVLFDLAVLCALSWVGWWWLLTAYLFHFFGYCVYRSNMTEASEDYYDNESDS